MKVIGEISPIHPRNPKIVRLASRITWGERKAKAILKGCSAQSRLERRQANAVLVVVLLELVL